MTLATTGPSEIAAVVFIDIALIVVVARLMGALFRRLHQPAVVGEILAGLLLGPSLLGAFPGNLPERLFPLEVRPYLKVIAELGLIIFMFIVGLELDTRLMRGKGRVAALISLSSVAFPFSLGLALAAVLHGSHGQVNGQAVAFLPFALFIGASMSVTAFPVLARILTERGMHRTEVGALVLACAAVDDILAWSLLAIVLAVVASSGMGSLLLILAASAVFVLVMFTVVRRGLKLLVDRYSRAGRLTPDLLAVILVGLLASAFATSKIGIHSIFGAFVFGTIMPREGTAELFREILERLEQVSVLLLLPVFFIATGLDANVRGLGPDGAAQLGLILLVACAGKFVGATLAARAQRIRTRKAVAIGVLMNTRGLTELVILNVGLAFGVLDGQLFTMLVMMAIFTTVIAEPLLRLVYPDRVLRRDVAEAERASLGLVDAYRVLLVVDDPARGEGLVDIGIAIIGDERPGELVITRFAPRPKQTELGSGLVSELADMAASLEALQALSQRAQTNGVSCAVRSQFSDDVGQDLLAQAVALDVDVLLIPDTEGVVVEQLWGNAPCAVAALARSVGAGLPSGRGGSVSVFASAGADAQAALELGVRLARSLGAQLRLVDHGQRRLSALAGQLADAGVPATIVNTAEEGGPDRLEVMGCRTPPAAGRKPPIPDAGGATPGTHIFVRAARDDDGEGLTRLLERLATSRHDEASI